MLVASLIDDAFIHICLFLTADEVQALSKVDKTLRRIVDGEDGFTESVDLLWDLLFHRDVPAVLHGITVQAMQEVFGDTTEADGQLRRDGRSASRLFYKRIDELYVELRAQDPQQTPNSSPTQGQALSVEHQTCLPAEAQNLEDRVLTETLIHAFRATTSWKKLYFNLCDINSRPSFIQGFEKTMANPFSFSTQSSVRPCITFLRNLFGEVCPIRIHEAVLSESDCDGEGRTLIHRRSTGRTKNTRGASSLLTASIFLGDTTAPLAILSNERRRFCSFRASPVRTVKVYNHFWDQIAGKLSVAQAFQDFLILFLAGYSGLYLHFFLSADVRKMGCIPIELTLSETLTQHQQSTFVPVVGVVCALRLARLMYCPFYHQGIQNATVLALLGEAMTDNLSFALSLVLSLRTLTPAIKRFEILFRDVFMKLMQPVLPVMVCGMTFFNTCPRAVIRAGPSPLRTKLLVKAVASSVVALVVSGLMLRKFPLHNVLYGLVRPLFRLSLWLAGTSLSAIPIDQAKRGDETAVIVLAGFLPTAFSFLKAVSQGNALMVFDELPPKLTKESLSRSMKEEERSQLGLDDSEDDSKLKDRSSPPTKPKKELKAFSVAMNALLRLQSETRVKFHRQVIALTVSRLAEEMLLTLVSVGLLFRDGTIKRAICFRAGTSLLLRAFTFGAAKLLPERS